MGEDIHAALREYTASKAEIEELLRLDPMNADIIQVRRSKEMLAYFSWKQMRGSGAEVAPLARSYMIWMLQ